MATEPARPRATRRPAAERRAEIVQTAMRAFAQRGYRETGTADIAREIGVSEPTLYRYFESKRELYLEAIGLGSREILDRWRQMADEAATPLDALLALGVWYFEELQRDSSPLMLRARAELETDDPEIISNLGSHFEETFEFIRGLYGKAQEQGLVSEEVDLDARAWFFLSLGSLIDRTHLLGVHDRLGEGEIARMVQSMAPELVPETVRRASEK